MAFNKMIIVKTMWEPFTDGKFFIAILKIFNCLGAIANLFSFLKQKYSQESGFSVNLVLSK